MNSPFTGKKMEVVYDKRIWNFRGEKYEYIHTAWLCPDSGELFTTDEMDNAGYTQVTNQYRSKYGIPFTDEIIAVRERYGVSAAKMAQILGFGINQWRNYESGEVPSVSNGRMIRSIMNSTVFLNFVDSSKNMLGDKEYQKIHSRISALQERDKDCGREEYDHARLFQCTRGIENGFAPQSLERLKNIILYIMEHFNDVFCTKMNKLLFYVDFLAYCRLGRAITGLSYRALEYGPVPDRWDRVYSQFDDITLEPRAYGEKEGYVLVSSVQSQMDMFPDEEKDILDEVCARFANCSSSDMTRISHSERAWLDNIEGYKRIPFASAFDIKAFK